MISLNCWKLTHLDGHSNILIIHFFKKNPIVKWYLNGNGIIIFLMFLLTIHSITEYLLLARHTAVNKMNESSVPTGFVFTTGKSMKEIITANLLEKIPKATFLFYSSSTKNQKDQKIKKTSHT